ncbi:hypothetical protein GGR58DRAFT_499926 [Xylaria digitata]|nr:hypothetical protein GGR58DRAFT_499926 [Xylaria digitata]
MSSLKEFTLFSKLPRELRDMVWKESILDYKPNRVVLIHKHNKMIICSGNVRCSPHFHATRESREIAKEFYNIRLSVSWVVNSWVRGISFIVDEDAEIRVGQNSPKGVVYISAEHDIFVFVNGLELDPTRTQAEYPLSADKYEANLGWRSSSLSLQQCQSVRHVMLLDRVRVYTLPHRCRGLPLCAIKCGAVRRNRFLDKEVFSGVETCLYVALREKWSDSELYSGLIAYPSYMLLETLEKRNEIMRFDREGVRKQEEESRSNVCVCMRYYEADRR